MQTRSLALVGAAALLLGGAWTSSMPSAHAGAAAKKPVTIRAKEVHERYMWAPKRLTVKRGTTVMWTNTTDTEHNVTFDSGGVGDFDKDLKEHQSVKFHFTKAGTYRYHCEYHPYMTAVVIVK